MMAPMFDLQIRPARAALLVFTATALFWLPSLANGFAWDDVGNLVDSARLRSWDALGLAFQHDANWSAERPQAIVGTYRPVPLALLALGTHLADGAPWAHHLVNVLLHAGAASLLYLLLRRWLTPPGHALPLALLWAVHPACVEGVAWINGLSEPVAMLPGLAALLVAARPGFPAVAATGALLLLALLGKETALVFVPLAVFFAREAHGRLRPAAMAGGLAVVAWLALRTMALSGGPLPGLGTHAGALVYAPAVWMRALRAALLPLEQGLLTLNTWLAGLPWLDVLTYALSSVLLVVLAILAWRRGERLLAAGVFWFLAALLPACLLAPTGWPGLYRWLYIALPGLWLVVHAIARHALAPRPLAGLAAAAFVGFAVQSQLGIRVWRDDESLFRTMIDEQPEESYGYTGLASHLLRTGRPEAALPVIEQGAAIDREGRPATFGLLAMALAQTGDCQAAAATLDKHFGAGEYPPYALEHTGLCHLRAGAREAARLQFERCRAQGNACAGHLERLPTPPP